MADALETHNIANLIQGVSQQVPMQRRDTQAEEQFDCINDPVSGCRARPSAELVAYLGSKAFDGAYVFDIERSADEHYAVVVLQGDLKVFDLADGTECTVTFPDGKAYLATTETPKDVFASTIVDDHAFIANRGIKPAMGTTTSASRPKEALAYFKAGAYSMTFTLSITYASTVYTWSYKTPDNSVSGNADYIATDQLAKTFYRALTGTAGTPSASGSTTATALGFSVGFVGSTLHIWRDDGQDFTITATDGAGDTYLVTIKDTAKSFASLPAKGIDGFTVKVKGSDGSKDDDYWVRYRATGGGFWEETVAPAVPLGLDAATMPFDLYNTNYRTFVFKKAPWGARVAGDAESAPNPSFVGKKIQDLFTDHSRLGILHEAGAVWSKSRNPYVFFRDSAQTILATDPIDYDVMGGRRITLFRYVVCTDESVFMWSPGGQFRVTSGSDPFKQDTIEAKLSASYEFSTKCPPVEIGKRLHFSSETKRWVALRELLVADGKIRGDTNITRHVPRYVPAPCRKIVGSDTLEGLVVFSDATPSKLYLYNSVTDDQNRRVQSAWNTLRLPEGSKILWHGITQSDLMVMAQWGTGVVILKLDLASDPIDEGETWHQRMDFRFTGSATSWDAETDTSTIPLALPIGTDPSKILVTVKTDVEDSFIRGQAFEVLSATSSNVVVSGDVRGADLFVGLKITSERTESRFFKRGEAGTVPTESLHVQDIVYSHAETGYYRAEVTHDNGRTYSYEFGGRYLGSPKNVLDKVALDTGRLEVPVATEAGSYTLRLVNDTHLPSAWQSATVHFKSVSRALAQGR